MSATTSTALKTEAVARRPVVIVDNTWREREEKRFATGHYKALPHQFYRFETMNHFAHHSIETKGSISFTDCPKKGMADRQTSMKPGKYLQKYFGDCMTHDEITRVASRFTAQFTDTPLKFAATAEEIVEVYKKGSFYSCMKGWRNVAGFAGDFQIAYLPKDDGDISGRVVICPERMFYISKAYGDECTLKTELQKLGYHEDTGGEAKGLKIYQDHGAYEPYDFGTLGRTTKKDAKGRPYLEYID